MNKPKYIVSVFLSIILLTPILITLTPNNVYADEVKTFVSQTGVDSYNDSTSWYPISSFGEIDIEATAFAMYQRSTYQNSGTHNDYSHTYRAFGTSQVTIEIYVKSSASADELLYKTYSVTNNTSTPKVAINKSFSYEITNYDKENYDYIKFSTTITTTNNGTAHWSWNDGGRNSKYNSEASYGSVQVTASYNPNPAFTGSLSSGNLTRPCAYIVFL